VLEKVLDKPKLMKGDYGNVVRLLKKARGRTTQPIMLIDDPANTLELATLPRPPAHGQCFGDSNVLVIAHAAKCVEALAKGLREDFQPYYATVTFFPSSTNTWTLDVTSARQVARSLVRWVCSWPIRCWKSTRRRSGTLWTPSRARWTPCSSPCVACSQDDLTTQGHHWLTDSHPPGHKHRVPQCPLSLSAGDLATAAAHKNPSVRKESLLCVARYMAKVKAVPPKTEVKLLADASVKVLARRLRRCAASVLR